MDGCFKLRSLEGGPHVTSDTDEQPFFVGL